AVAARAPELPLYRYEFGEPEPPVPSGLPQLADFPYGAAHGFELPFLFPSVPTERPLTDAQLALSGRMVDYWTNFARTGSPNRPDAPLWPALRAAGPRDQPVQSLAAGPGGIRPVDADSAHQCPFWDAVGRTGRS
ncbi:carboxylesterase family protein, partial [Streptomyces sp. NPDC001546]